MASTDLNVHFSASARDDHWERLRSAAVELGSTVRADERTKPALRKVSELLRILDSMESLWAFPGRAEFDRLLQLIATGSYRTFRDDVLRIFDLIESRGYREAAVARARGGPTCAVHYFEVLVVGRVDAKDTSHLREGLVQWRGGRDAFVYDVVVVPSIEEALTAVLLNCDIQSVVVHDDLAVESDRMTKGPIDLSSLMRGETGSGPSGNRSLALGRTIHDLRPELDLFMLTSVPPTDLAGNARYFNRLFHRYDNAGELHLSILKSVGRRFRTPFFDALKAYSREPVGAFHALPISRGNSVFRSPWMKDFHDFYGRDIFLAESSATTGGLDSLLQPTGTLQEAQWKANICFGSRQTFFVTAGTSAANKIVHQSLTKEGDIVLIDRAAHESHHMALLLTGASPYYLPSYALDRYSIAGGVPLKTVKRALIELAGQGLLDRVKMITLTNCTFDGLIYNVERYMQEILSIKPDIVFLWDEAWFAFARFVPSYRQRTAMHVAERLARRYRSDEYRAEFQEHARTFLAANPEPGPAWLDEPLMPDPDLVSVRVYATQSTHKTLSSLRQGSMIHVWDEDFNRRSRDQFYKAYLTHTTTSPNYQILASLDVSRRQMQLEGYELVQRSIEMALIIRRAINTHPSLNRYFHALGPQELIPDEYRSPGANGIDPRTESAAMANAWANDDFVLDPCRINVYIGKTGVDGFTFRTEYLAKRCNIQVNKTGLNTVVIMTNIGTTRSAVTYLIESLIRMATEFETNDHAFSDEQRRTFEARRERVTCLPPLPTFSGFHAGFLLDRKGLPGEVRRAYFDGYGSDCICHFHIHELAELLDEGRTLVAATFVIPVPPGFPLLVPGQVLDRATATFLGALNRGEIIGLDDELGIRFFRDEFLAARPVAVGGATCAKPPAPPRLARDVAGEPAAVPARVSAG